MSDRAGWRMMYWTRLERMVLAEMAESFTMVLLALTFVLLVAAAYEPVRDGLPLATVARHLPLMITYWLPWTISLAFVSACIMVYSRMAGSNELTAVRASGLHLWRVLTPAAGMAVVLSAACAVLNHEVVPRSLFAQYGMAREANVSGIRQMIHRGDPVMEIGGQQKVYMEEIRDDDTFRNIMIVTEPTRLGPATPGEGEMVTYVYAPRGRLEFRYERSEVMFYLESDPALNTADQPNAGRGVVYQGVHGANPQDFTRAYFEDSTYPVKVRSMEDLRFLPQKGKHITTAVMILKIRERAKAMREAGRAAARPSGATAEEAAKAALEAKKRERDRLELCNWRTDVQKRSAMALSPLLLGGIAVPLGVMTRKGRRLTAFAVALALVVGGYYPLMVAAAALGDTGQMQPVAAVWGATAFVSAVAWMMLRNMLRR